MTLASGVNTGQTMPYSGSIVALSVSANANVTAGTVAFNVHNGGTAYAQESSLLTTLTTAAGSSNAKYSSIRAGVLTFAAGDKIGVNYASATNYAATTVDYDVVLHYVLNPV
jgi:flagellar capping protein FliD